MTAVLVAYFAVWALLELCQTERAYRFSARHRAARWAFAAPRFAGVLVERAMDLVLGPIARIGRRP